MSSAKPFCGRRVEAMVASVRKNAEPLESPQEEGKTDLHAFYCMRDFHSKERADCVVRTKMSLTAWELFSHRASSFKAKKVRRQKRKHRAELTGKNEKQKRTLNKPESAKKTVARLEKVVRG